MWQAPQRSGLQPKLFAIRLQLMHTAGDHQQTYNENLNMTWTVSNKLDLGLPLQQGQAAASRSVHTQLCCMRRTAAACISTDVLKKHKCSVRQQHASEQVC